MRLKSRLVSLIIILNLIHRIRTQFKPFHCDSSSKRSFLKNIRNEDVMMFALNGEDDSINIVLREKVIRFQLPYVNQVGENRSYYVNRHPFIKDQHQNEITEQAVGMFHTSSTNSSYLVMKNDFRMLRFSNDSISWETPVDMASNFSQKVRSKTSEIWSADLTANGSLSVVEYESNRMSVRMYDHNELDKLIGNLSTTRDELIKFAIVFNLREEEIRLPVIVVELDDQMSLHLHQFEIANHIDVDQFEVKNRIGADHLVYYKFRLEEFFNCYNKESDDLKGVYYGGEFYYLFIGHFYLEIKDSELVENKFLLSDYDYKRPKAFRFENDEVYKNVRYEDGYTKWIKITYDDTYLVLYDQVFDINVDKAKHELFFIENTSMKHLVNCPKQTLNVEDNIFCFEEFNYYLLERTTGNTNASKVYDLPIRDLFTDTMVTYEEGQSLQFIINYKEDMFIFLTETHQFEVAYASLTISSDKLKLSIKPDSFLRKRENCLFRKCSIMPISSSIKVWITLLILLIIIVIVLFSILVLYRLKTFEKISTQIQMLDKKETPDVENDLLSDNQIRTYQRIPNKRFRIMNFSNTINLRCTYGIYVEDADEHERKNCTNNFWNNTHLFSMDRKFCKCKYYFEVEQGITRLGSNLTYARFYIDKPDVNDNKSHSIGTT